MTLNGAIKQLHELRSAEDMPIYYKPAIAEVINVLLTDTQEVWHGQWLTKEYMYGDPDVGTEDMWIDRLAQQSDYYAYCSICGKDAGYNGEGSLILSDYCPQCGAKMDLEE